MPLRVRVLGSLVADGDAHAVPLDSLRERERALLALLALRHGHVVPREEIGDLLFGHLDPTRAAANVRVAVSRLRSALGTASDIETARAGLRLAPAATVDVEEFESRAERGRRSLQERNLESARVELLAALALYGGDVLEAETQWEWVAPARSRLRARRLDAMDDLADAYLGLGRANEAVALLERAVELDSTREASYRRLMWAYYERGDQDAALRAYERCRKALDAELGVDPLPETMAAHERILRREPLPPTASAARTVHERWPFVARTAERIVLDSAIARGARGGVYVLVVGEPGAGKTRLVDEALRRRTEVAVLASRCFELERDLPLQPLRDALGDRAPAMDAIGHERRAGLIESYARAVLSCGGGRPIVWWIDDVQWADHSTLEVLHFVARRSAGERIAIVAAGHAESLPPEHPATRLLTDLRREDRAERIALPPLAVDDVAVLARASQVRADAATMHARSGGNPFFVTELLMAMRRGSGTLPETARDAVLARSHVLAPDARRALDAAAILGGRFRPREIAIVAELDDTAVASALATLQSQALVRSLPNGEHELVHLLVRDAIYTDIAPALRVTLHGRAIEAVDSVRGEEGASLICYHAELAGDAECAFACAVSSGARALAAGAGAEALASFDRALRQPSDEASRARCLALQADARHLLGIGNAVEAPR